MTPSNQIKVLELFGGIGACTDALRRLGMSVEVVDYVEIDKFAIRSFNAIHGTNFEPQDIREWDKNIDVDLIMHGSPCQDFSVAGRQAGGDKDSGTRSSLMYETLRIVEKLKPKYVIWENVKNILSVKHRHNFDAYQDKMGELGYRNYFQVLNAKDYGIPQNRERVFTVSIRRDIDKDFVFPEKRTLTRFLIDILESNPDEKYYLSDTCVESLIRHNARHKEKGTGFIWKPRDPKKYASALRANASLAATDNTIKVVGSLDNKGYESARRVYDSSGVSPSINTCQGGGRQPKIIDDTYRNRAARESELSPTLRSGRSGLKVAEPFIVASRGRNPDNPSDRATGSPTKQRLEPKIDGTTNTITTVQKDNLVANKSRIRRLTPRECWRLMGFSDVEFNKAKSVCSDTQLYKQAGNSIVVDVLMAIFARLFSRNKSTENTGKNLESKVKYNKS